MENKAYALAAGLFTLLLGAGVIFVAMWFSGKTESRESFVRSEERRVGKECRL